MRRNCLKYRGGRTTAAPRKDEITFLEETKRFMSDVVGDDYKSWQPGEIIGLSGGTGTGKTTLVLGTIAKKVQEQGKSILYLCNRIPLMNDTMDDVKKKYKLDMKLIRVTTYQKLQSELESGVEHKKYDYIFCDECHYFFTDAIFNPATDISYKYLTNRDDAVVILMSATASKLFTYLISKDKMKLSHLYYTPQDYSYVDKVLVYEPGAFFQLVENVLAQDPDAKVICFVNGKRMVEAYARYGDKAHYMCSSYSDDEKIRVICGLPRVRPNGYKANQDKKAMENAIIKKLSRDLITFEKRILFTTRTMENGVTLKDRRIKAIFSELIDPDALVQSLGRKRSLSDDDTCTFYIKRFQTNWMVGAINRFRGWLSDAKVAISNPDYFKKTYVRPSNGDKLRKNEILRYDNDVPVGVNMMRYRKYEMDMQTYERIHEIGFDAALIETLGDMLAAKIVSDNTLPGDEDLLKEFLEELREKRLYKEEQAKIKEMFKKYGLNLAKVPRKGKRPQGISALNGVLETRYGDTYKPRFINKDPATGKYFRDRRRRLDDETENPHYDSAYWLLNDGE